MNIFVREILLATWLHLQGHISILNFKTKSNVDTLMLRKLFLRRFIQLIINACIFSHYFFFQTTFFNEMLFFICSFRIKFFNALFAISFFYEIQFDLNYVNRKNVSTIIFIHFLCLVFSPFSQSSLNTVDFHFRS